MRRKLFRWRWTWQLLKLLLLKCFATTKWIAAVMLQSFCTRFVVFTSPFPSNLKLLTPNGKHIISFSVQWLHRTEFFSVYTVSQFYCIHTKNQLNANEIKKSREDEMDYMMWQRRLYAFSIEWRTIFIEELYGQTDWEMRILTMWKSTDKVKRQ